MTPEQLGAIAGVILSLAFQYIPRLSPWYEPLEPTAKRLIMLGVMLVVSVAIFGLSCSALNLPAVLVVTCDQGGAMALLNTFIMAVIGSQAAYLIAPKPKQVASGGPV